MILILSILNLSNLAKHKTFFEKFAPRRLCHFENFMVTRWSAHILCLCFGRTEIKGPVLDHIGPNRQTYNDYAVTYEE